MIIACIWYKGQKDLDLFDIYKILIFLHFNIIQVHDIHSV